MDSRHDRGACDPKVHDWEMNTETIRLFANATLLETRFGGWPSFHDAEVLRGELSRDHDVVLSMDV